MNKKHFKSLALLLLVVVSVLSLSGCNMRYFLDRLNERTTYENVTTEQETTEQGQYVPREEDFVGSAVQLNGTVIAVFIFLDDAESSWDTREMEAVKDRFEIASDYIEDSALEYGKEIRIISDTGEYSDLSYETYYNGAVGDFDTLTESDYDPYQEALIDEINYNIPTTSLLRKYNAQSIAYIGVVDKGGRSYAYPYDTEYDQRYYYECTCLFFTDETYGEEEPPAVYAHEFLHLFGAQDLYENSDSYYNYFTPEQYDYIETYYSNEIMYTTYDEYGYSVQDWVSNEISDITAYYLGWIDTMPTGFVNQP